MHFRHATVTHAHKHGTTQPTRIKKLAPETNDCGPRKVDLRVTVPEYNIPSSLNTSTFCKSLWSLCSWDLHYGGNVVQEDNTFVWWSKQPRRLKAIAYKLLPSFVKDSNWISGSCWATNTFTSLLKKPKLILNYILWCTVILSRINVFLCRKIKKYTYRCTKTRNRSFLCTEMEIYITDIQTYR